MTNTLAARPQVASALALFEAWIEAHMAYSGQPGLSAGVVYDQELIWARGFGQADRQRGLAASPQTIYRIASITKLFTSTALMQLRDAGRLQLDDPLTRHLPFFQVRSRFEDAPAITIRHLLTHSSGLPREAAFPYWTDGVFPTREQLLATLPEQQAIYAPETRWKYSNLALTLAGEVVAAVSGQPYAEYIQQHILDPLEMAGTSVVLPDTQRERLAAAYGRRLPDGSRAEMAFTDCAAITPAANMSSTVEDLARFAMLQFRDGAAGGRQILRGSTLREMQRVHWLDESWQSGWGLGFALRRREERTLVEHGGAVPGYRTQVSICPADKLAFVVLTNADDGDPLGYVEQAHNLVAPALRAATPEAAPAEVPPEWQRYVGKYRNIWGDSQVLILNGRLSLIAPTEQDLNATLTHLTPEGEHCFRMQGTNGYAALGELAQFELDASGAVTRLKTGENYTYPLKDEG